jgi:hypothetical protein
MTVDRERLRAEFPAVDERTIRDWLADFKLVGEEIWSIAKEGGPQRSATRWCGLLFEPDSLVGRGLRKACFLATYDAWHEGFDREPKEE